MKPHRTNLNLAFFPMIMIVILLVACNPQSGQPTSSVNQGGELTTPLPTQVIVVDSTPFQPTLTAMETATQAQPTTQEPTQASFDPCAYLTTEEISQVINQTIVKAVPSNTSRPNCHYMTETDANGYNASVVVYVFTDPSAPGGFEIGKTAQDENPQTVTGVGDEAYWAPSLDNLNVLYKDVYFTVQFLGTENQSVDLAKELALKVIAHMQEKGVPN